MELTRWNTDNFPFEFGRLFNLQWSPALDLREEDDNLLLKLDLPGMEEKDINVEVEDQSVFVSGERQSETKEEKEGWYRKERSYGSFSRTIPLPYRVKAEEAKALFHNGVLEIKLPKREAQEPKRVTLEVKNGNGDSEASQERTKDASAAPGSALTGDAANPPKLDAP